MNVLWSIINVQLCNIWWILLFSFPHPCNKGVSGRLSELPLIEDICQAKLKPSECSVVQFVFSAFCQKCSIVQYMVEIVVTFPHPCNKGVSGRLSESPQCFNYWRPITQCFVKRAQSDICLGLEQVFTSNNFATIMAPQCCNPA